MKSLRRSLDPEGPFVRKWNKICVICCLIAVCLDPLLFYIPFLDAEQLCLSLDKKLAITFCVLRSCIDLFYVFHIFLKFIAPTCRVIGAGLLVMDSRAIMKRYLQSYFIMDILSILPLPQVVIVIAPALRNWIKINPLTILINGQNLVRFLRIIPLLKEVTKTSGVLTETAAWSGAISNFCLYMLASHVIGSFWYLSSFERAARCWRNACGYYNQCNFDYLYCGGHHGNNTFLFSSCSPLEPSKSAFDYGIFRDALALQLYRDSFRRFFYCFVWGLRNLSSLGQNLETSNNNMGENLFVVVISIIGLILFSFLAGNVQRFLHSLTDRADKMREKLDDKEKWMSRTMVPPELRLRVRQYEQYRWQQNGGVDEESLIRDLPKDLRMDIKRHQCRRMLIRVPMFNKMDDQLLDALCCCLKRVFYTEGSIIVREGYPVDEMLFIKTGKILGSRSTSTNNVMLLEADDFCGEELLTWAIDPNSSSSSCLPISTRTLRAVDNVEAFSLMHDDLKCQFRYLERERLEHMFRYSSRRWRSWGACIIQTAWRLYHRRKIERSLKEAEDRNAYYGFRS